MIKQEHYMKKLEECSEEDVIEHSYTARFIPDKKISGNRRREHCVASLDQINKIGITIGQQVRIERPTESGTALALYTIVDDHDRESDIVFVGYEIRGDFEERFDLKNYPFTGKVEAQVTAEGLSDKQAENCSEFVERLTDNGVNQRLVVIAPHGGNIEKFTDLQADHVREQFSSDHISEWICKGFKKGGGAYDRWHITSTDISENSFPELKKIMGRNFEYSIAFHGWTGDSICIGGSMRDDLKQEIKTQIKNKISDPEITVEVAQEDGDTKACPSSFNGDHEDNIVNRLCKPGGQSLQIEQSEKARKRYHIAIAEAGVNVIRHLIEV
jgi:phage replication-related protein YjqB (UPF0714/DUF867 family)